MRPMLLSLALVATLGWSAPAFAGTNWATTFPAAAVDSQITAPSLRYLVVAAGDKGVDTVAAGAALEAALKASAQVKLVMTTDGLGDLTALDDAAIVAKAKARPVDQVWIVRVFPGSGGDTTAVVTSYTLDGNVATAFTASTKEPLVAKAGGAPAAGAGLSNAAAAAISGGGTPAQSAAIEEYEKRAIVRQGFASVDAQTGVVMSTWTTLYKGKYHESLAGAKLYEYLGRDDLAKQYRGRSALNTVAFIGGIGAMIGGTTWMTTGLFNYTVPPDEACWEFDTSTSTTYGLTSSPYQDEYDDCVDDQKKENAKIRAQQTSSLVGGGALTAVGLVGMLVPVFHRTQPVPAPQVYEMVDKFNKDLRQELGIPEPTSMVTPRPPAWELTGYAWVNDGMAGGTVRLDF